MSLFCKKLDKYELEKRLFEVYKWELTCATTTGDSNSVPLSKTFSILIGPNKRQLSSIIGELTEQLIEEEV